jgi:hypothetical protein
MSPRPRRAASRRRRLEVPRAEWVARGPPGRLQRTRSVEPVQPTRVARAPPGPPGSTPSGVTCRRNSRCEASPLLSSVHCPSKELELICAALVAVLTHTHQVGHHATIAACSRFTTTIGNAPRGRDRWPDTAARYRQEHVPREPTQFLLGRSRVGPPRGPGIQDLQEIERLTGPHLAKEIAVGRCHNGVATNRDRMTATSWACSSAPPSAPGSAKIPPCLSIRSERSSA